MQYITVLLQSKECIWWQKVKIFMLTEHLLIKHQVMRVFHFFLLKDYPVNVYLESAVTVLIYYLNLFHKKRH